MRKVKISHVFFVTGIILAAQVECFSMAKPQRVTLSAEVLVFDRVGIDNYKLVERVPGSTYFFGIPSTPGKQVLNSTDLKQGFEPGFRVGAAYHIDSTHDIAASFFRIGDWAEHKSIGPDKPLDWLVMRAPGGFFQTQDFTYQSMKWDYSAKLYNAELNTQKKFSNSLSMLFGFRWLQLHENLQGTIPPADRIQPTWKNYPKANIDYVAWFEKQPGTPAQVYPPFWDTNVTNNLYGLQLGLVGRLFKYRQLSLNGLLKIGGYVNHASDKAGVSIAKVVYHAGDTTNHPAFVGEIGLLGKYQVISGVRLKLGYEALWLAGVALAPGQIHKTYSAHAPTSVHILGVSASSSVLFHGGVAGVELSF